MEFQVPQADRENAPGDQSQVVPENGLQVVPEIEPQDEQEDEQEDEPQVVPIVVEPEDEPQDVPIIVEPEEEPQVVPIIVDPLDEPQVAPIIVQLEYGPQDESEDEPQVVPIIVEPEDEPQVVPEIDIQAEPEDESQVVPEIEPEAMLEDEPQVEPDREEVSVDEWNHMFYKGKFKKGDMNMMIMDFLIDKELPLVTEAFHRESACLMGIDDEDLSNVGTQKIVKDLIINCQFDDAIKTLNETMTPVFLQIWPRIQFYLEQQKMVELCRRGDFKAALIFSHKFIKWESFEPEDDSFSFRKACRSTLLLMLFGDDEESPVPELLHYTNIFWLASLVVVKMIKYQGRRKGNYVEKAWKMVGWEEYELYQLVKFPYFDRISGYPKLKQFVNGV